MQDYYQLLDCDYGCNEQSLKRAYRLKAKDSHPDHGGDKMLFNKIKDAYDTLCDAGKRTAYDRQLGLRKYKGRFYRISNPATVSEPARDIYDDIKGVVWQRLRKNMGGTVQIEIPAQSLITNRDGVVLLAPRLEAVCPKCLGFGGWLGSCKECQGSGRVHKEFLLPFSLETEVHPETIISFTYQNFQVRVVVT